MAKTLKWGNKKAMLYIGHFSFRENGTEVRHGYFTMVLEGENITKILNGFESLLEKLQEQELLFQGPVVIYLDAVTQVKAIPEEGIMAHMLSRKGGLGTSVSISLPSVSREYAEHFGVVPEPLEGDNIGETLVLAPLMPEPDEVEIAPFLRFD